jgi:uncharacterized protein YndB with AHSA1/START domain
MDRWVRVKVLLVAALLTAGLPGGVTPREPSARSVVFREEAVVAADPARVWQLLVDLDGYASWNPWVVRADGVAAPGADVRVDVVLNGHVMQARHTVLTVRPEAEFCWKDAGWNSWFVYGQRCRRLERRPDGTVLFRQELLLDGPPRGAASLAMGRALRAGMPAETAALKQHAEG